MKNLVILVGGSLGLTLGFVGFLAVRPPGGDALEVLPALYHALGLFVLNAGPNGLPAGDPAWAVAVLWAAHFLAPLSLASFLGDAFLSLVKSRAHSYRRKEGHTVVCGLGKTALLAVEEILKHEPARNVVVVELFPENPQLPRVQARGVPVVMGSMEEEVVLRRAGVAGARRFLAFANDDILNINAAATARRLNQAPRFTAVAQAVDARLCENLPASLKKDITFLNTYDIAATALVKAKRLTRGYEDSYVIAGFGNFGQMMLQALLRDEATARGDRFFVVDRDAEEKVRIWVQTFGYGDHDIRPVKGNLHDPDLWAGLTTDLDEAVPEGKKRYDPIVLVCTDNDVSNLSFALSIRRHYVKDSVIYCRLFGEVSFEKAMIQGHKIETYRIDELLRANLPADVLSRSRH